MTSKPTSFRVSPDITIVNPPENFTLQPSLPGLIHHNVPHRGTYLFSLKGVWDGLRRYGVSRNQRVLTSGNLLKHWGRLAPLLGDRLGLSTTQQTAVKRLLRLWAYYGLVYPKASQVAHEPTVEEMIISLNAGGAGGEAARSYGCSKSTFWRTVRKLRDMGLVEVVNRYVLREHAQVSNLYRLDKLIIVLARYLAEHGRQNFPKWIRFYLAYSGTAFWSLDWAIPGRNPPHIGYSGIDAF